MKRISVRNRPIASLLQEGIESIEDGKNAAIQEIRAEAELQIANIMREAENCKQAIAFLAEWTQSDESLAFYLQNNVNGMAQAANALLEINKIAWELANDIFSHDDIVEQIMSGNGTFVDIKLAVDTKRSIRSIGWGTFGRKNDPWRVRRTAITISESGALAVEAYRTHVSLDSLQTVHAQRG